MCECGICFDKTSDFTTECNHSFCNGCATEWLLSNNSCPVCRKEFYPISEEELEEIELINRQNEITASPIVRVNPLFTEIITIYFLDSVMYYQATLIYNICFFNQVEPKLPKNINMKYRKEYYRFDNTNYNHMASRY